MIEAAVDGGDDLSLEQSAALLAQVGVILSFDVKKIAKYKKAIKKSISVSAQLRQELENSSVSAVQEYMKQRAALFEKKSELLGRRVELEQALAAQKETLQLAETILGKTQTRLEAELKKASINDISARAIVMLDKLQRVLYRQQIAKVEDFFRVEIKTLMRKTQFIDDIKIDDDFNIFLYRHEPISCSILLDALKEKDEAHLAEAIGHEAVQELYQIVGSTSLEAVMSYCASGKVDPNGVMEVFEVYPETEITRISSPGDNISFAGIQIRIQGGYEFSWKLGTESFNRSEILLFAFCELCIVGTK